MADEPAQNMRQFPCGKTRREFVWEMGGGFTGVALASLLLEEGFFARHAGAAPLTEKSFYLGHSHISDTAHLDRLLIATFLAYLWLVCLGEWVKQTGRVKLIHRSDRCDWSLFQIGLAWIAFCLNEDIPLWIIFAPPKRHPTESVG
jgi:hypothetical protein